MRISETSISATGWLIKRFLWALLITMAVSIGQAYFRVSGVFLIGFQGMATGALIGWLVGRLGRQDPGVYWAFNQRCWLGVSMAVAYMIIHLVTLSILNAGPVDTPLYWLGEIMQGFQKEEFASSGRFQAIQGKMEGGWWVCMNILDAGLFWFLFIALCVVGVCPDAREDEADAIDEPNEATEEAILPSHSHIAFYGLLLVLAGISIAGGLYWQSISGPEPQTTYSAGIAAMKQYEGQWRFVTGQGLFPNDEEARSFTITPLSRDGLLLKGVTGNFTLSLTKEGQMFSGLLFLLRQTNASAQFSARVRFSPEHNTLTMAVVNFEIGGRRDIVLQGKRLGN